MKKKIVVLIGSASRNSANQKLVDNFITLTAERFEFTVYNDLKLLPHFDPELSANNPPGFIADFRAAIDSADGVLISTPEYIFSIPAGLKNAIEWCVATTVFSNKPLGIITASLQGQMAHDELQMIMKTIMAVFSNETTLLIPGVKAKIDINGNITDPKTKHDLEHFAKAFTALVNGTGTFNLPA